MPIELLEHEEGGIQISTIAIDAPPLNVLDLDHCHEFTSCLNQIRADDRSRVVIIRGRGKGFSAGVDIKQHTPEMMPELLPAFHAIFHDLLGLRAITVAAVHGLCLGGGAEIALACDRVIAEENARISFPEILLGCYPPVALALLPYRVGPGMATKMILGAVDVDAKNWKNLRLVDRVCAPGTLDEAIADEVKNYHGKSPAVVGMTAGLLHEEARRAWGDRIPYFEKEYLDALLPHPDVAEGITAYLEKRTPAWQSPDEKVNPEDSLL